MMTLLSSNTSMPTTTFMMAPPPVTAANPTSKEEAMPRNGGASSPSTSTMPPSIASPSSPTLTPLHSTTLQVFSPKDHSGSTSTGPSILLPLLCSCPLFYCSFIHNEGREGPLQQQPWKDWISRVHLDNHSNAAWNF